jgi:Secretion system C-terminal sorting domain
MGITKNATVGTASYTNLVRGFAWYTNTTPQTGLFSFGLAPTTPFQLTSTDNTWVKLAFSYNKTTGQVKWKGPSGINPAAQIIGAAPGNNPGEIDLIGATGTTTAIPNAASAIRAFDNIIVRASSTDALLAVNSAIPNDSFVVFPNPVNNILTIKSNGQLKHIQVTDVNGRIVKMIDVTNSSASEINTSDLSSGVYIMKIKSENGGATKK